MEDRRNVGEKSCNSGDGTDQTGPILDDDDDEVRLRAGTLLSIPSPSPNKSDIEILVGFILPDVTVESVPNQFLGFNGAFVRL